MTTAGIWIDHRRAVVVRIADGVETTLEIRSDVERRTGLAGGVRSAGARPSRPVPADDSRQRRLSGLLGGFYDRVTAELGDADSILILGPGEAKGEFRARLERRRPETPGTVELVSAGRMTGPQIVARVREHAARSAPPPDGTKRSRPKPRRPR